MVEAKHEFIDDNPYLVYSSDAEATASGSGGGAGFPVVEIDENDSLNVTAGELDNMLKTSPAMLNFGSKGDTNWIFLVYSSYNEDTGYLFSAYSVATESVVNFEATSASGYPALA